jgi:hypothetical protein
MKKLDMLNKPIEKAIHKFDIKSKAKLIGSNSFRGVLFGSDYDVESKLTGSPAVLASHFKKVVSNLDGVLFMDFKAGLDHRLIYDFDNDSLDEYIKNPLIPTKYVNKIKKAKGEDRVKLIRDLYILRWTPKSIKRGYIKLIDGTKKTFEDALKDDTMIKIDFAVPVGNTFAEVSENYTYKQTPVDIKQILQELADDVEKYKHENTMKSLKRLYSIMEIKKSYPEARLRMLSFFNSDAGLVNKCANDLAFLVDITKKHNISWDKIKANIQMIKERLSSVAWVAGKKITDMNQWTESNFKSKIDALIRYLRHKINPRALEVLRSVS